MKDVLEKKLEENAIFKPRNVGFSPGNLATLNNS